MCSRQTSAKYVARDSPPFPANACCGQTRVGNNGEVWASTRTGAQTACTWKKASPKRSPRASPRRSPRAPTRSRKAKRVMSMATCVSDYMRDEDTSTPAMWASWKAYARKFCKQEIQDLKNGR